MVRGNLHSGAFIRARFQNGTLRVALRKAVDSLRQPLRNTLRLLALKGVVYSFVGGFAESLLKIRGDPRFGLCGRFCVKVGGSLGSKVNGWAQHESREEPFTCFAMF